MEPEVLLLDEPLSNLDAKLREEMRVELKTIQQKTGIPILYVTHDQLEAMALSDRIAVMKDGVILQCDDPATIYRRPATQFVYDFIGQSNYIDCEIQRENGSELEVRVDGRSIRIPKPHQMPANKEARLGVRPEDIRLTRSPDNTNNLLTGEVKIHLYLGNLIEYRVELGDRLLQVHSNKDDVFSEGDAVQVSFTEAMLWDRA